MKYNVDDSVNWYKVGLVVKGYAQTHKIDYNKTFTPMAKMTTDPMVLVVVAARGWHLHQMDMKNASLQNVLHRFDIKLNFIN